MVCSYYPAVTPHTLTPFVLYLKRPTSEDRPSNYSLEVDAHYLILVFIQPSDDFSRCQESRTLFTTFYDLILSRNTNDEADELER